MTMSALTVSLAAYDAQHPPSPPSVLPTLPVLEDSDADVASPPPSSSPSSSQLSTLTASSSHSSTSTSSSSADSASSASSYTSMKLRANEHLAVLLPKHLWKEDALASACDNFYCRVRFSLFERRHHCRKCGSIFCAACTSHTTALLDTSSPLLPFTHPPHRTPIALYASKDSPVLDNARVCTACFDQIHGIPRQHTPELVKCVKGKPSISSLTSSSSRSSASSSASASDSPVTPTSPSTPHTRTRTRSKRRISLLTSTQPTLPADVLAALSSLSQHPHHTLAHLTHHASSNTKTSGNTSSRATSPVSDDARPFGELSVYPLTRHSAVCKAMGGGRWTPTPSSPHSPLHSPLYTSPLNSPLNHPNTTWSEKGVGEKKCRGSGGGGGYFDLGEIVSDEAGFRYRRVLHVQEEAEQEGVRPF